MWMFPTEDACAGSHVLASNGTQERIYGFNNLSSRVKDQAIFYLTLNIFLSSQGCGDQNWLGTKWEH